MSDSESDDNVPVILTTPTRTTRSQRSRPEKLTNRLDALERLKNARAGGAKHKYEVKEIQNVYDVVDEGTYSRKVTDRQKDDWIVDDGGGDYVEDGREIFDDDLNDDDEYSQRKKHKNKKEKAAKKAEKDTQRAEFGNVRAMLSSMPVKRKREVPLTKEPERVQFTGEDLLGDILSDLKTKRNHRGGREVSQTPSGAIRYPAPMDGDDSDEPEQPIQKQLNQKPKHLNSGIVNGSNLEARLNNVSVSRKPERKESVDLAGNPAKRTRYSIKKKSFVPFGASSEAKPEPSYTTFEDDGPDMSDDTFDLDTSNQPSTSSNSGFNKSKPSTSNGSSKFTNDSKTSTNGSSKLPSTNVKISHAASNATIASSRTVKPAQSKQRQLASIENFGSFGQINGNGTEIGLEDSATAFDEGDVNDSTILNFYWLDIFEEPRNPGVLYLFGKVQSTPGNYVSACIVVKDLNRCVHLLFRDTMKSDSDVPVNGVDVYAEFNEVIAPKFKINEFKSRPVQKRYCFDLEDVPSSANYIEIRYSGTLPPLPADLEGETFSKVFGTGTPLMENFLLEKKLKGPSWLQIKNPLEVEFSQRHSWCKMEYTCGVSSLRLNEKSADKKIPPLVLASLNIQATSDANSKKETIVFIGVAVNKAFEPNVPLQADKLYHDYFCLVNKPPGEIWPLDVEQVFTQEASKNSKMDSERSLLACFLAKLQQLDADIYLGHDLNFDLLLVHLINLKVPHWSKLGRLKRASHMGKNGKTLDYKSTLAGRLFCDVKISSMELIRARSYDFQNLAMQVLGKQAETLTGAEIKQQFESATGLQYLINWGMNHCVTNIQLVNELQVLPLALQITAIAGNTLFRTLLGGRSERNEYLLLHAFHSKGFIVPDKYRPFLKGPKGAEGGDAKEKKGSGPSYAGGMVLDPKKGFYDKYIVLMDFNSLYPSIIQEYNICFTTRGEGRTSAPSEEDGKGILPEEIRKLVESRRQVKALMKNPKLAPQIRRVYDIRQMAFKLTANSMYGCLGFRNSRFYAKDLAAMITGYGRDILLKTKDAVERMGFEVIYGDTDSLMINSNSTEIPEVRGIGEKIKAEVNKMYKLLELEIDGIFKYLLLLKKKKYAALVYNEKPNGESSTTLELKGLDMVRRDWAPIASNTARLILEEIMSEQSLDDKVFKICRILNEVAENLKIGNIQLKDLLITKQLAKNPEEYKEAQGLYHVQVALRMNKSGALAKKFRNGDTVPYLFCTDGLPHHLSELSPVVKADEGEEVAEEVKFSPDATYYLAHQIHPVVSRICEPLEELDAGRIAEELGMDATSFRRRRTADRDAVEDKALGQESDAEKYADCEKFVFNCPHSECGKENRYESMFVTKGSEITFRLLNCQDCGNSLTPFAEHLSNRLTLFLRKFVCKFYLNEYICEDPTCDNVERGVPLSLTNGFPACRRCGQGLMCQDYRSAHLFKQLTYLHNLFDFDKQIETLSDKDKAHIRQLLRDSSPEIQKVTSTCETLKARLSERLQSSGYSEIKLGALFYGLFPKKSQFKLYDSTIVEARETAD